MSNALELRQKNKHLLNLIDVSREAAISVMPSGIDFEKLKHSFQVLLSGNPKLSECTPISVINCMFQCSQSGLYPNNNLGHVWIIPYYNKDIGQLEAQFQPGYKGTIHLAMKTNRFGPVTAYPVYENDSWEYKDENGEITFSHSPNLMNRGEVKFYFAYCTEKETGKLITGYATKQEVEKIEMATRKGQKQTPAWRKFFNSMALRTPINKMFEYRDVSPELNEAISLMNQADAGVSQQLTGKTLSIDNIPREVVKAAEQFEEAKIEVVKNDEKEKQVEKGEKAGKAALESLTSEIDGSIAAMPPEQPDFEYKEIRTKIQAETIFKKLQSSKKSLEELNAILKKADVEYGYEDKGQLAQCITDVIFIDVLKPHL